LLLRACLEFSLLRSWLEQPLLSALQISIAMNFEVGNISRQIVLAQLPAFLTRGCARPRRACA